MLVMPQDGIPCSLNKAQSTEIYIQSLNLCNCNSTASTPAKSLLYRHLVKAWLEAAMSKTRVSEYGVCVGD